MTPPIGPQIEARRCLQNPERFKPILPTRGPRSDLLLVEVVTWHASGSRRSRRQAYRRCTGIGATGTCVCGQADVDNELRARVVIWPPLRSARLRCERESVVVVCPRIPAVSSLQEVAYESHRFGRP